MAISTTLALLRRGPSVYWIFIVRHTMLLSVIKTGINIALMALLSIHFSPFIFTFVQVVKFYQIFLIKNGTI